MHRFIVSFTLAAAFAGCASAIVDPDTAPEEPDPQRTGGNVPGLRDDVDGAQPSAPAPSELAALMHRVHFAYHDDGDALRGGHDSYLASIARGASRLAFTPQRAAPDAAAVRGDAVQVETLGAWRGGAAVAAAASLATIDDDGSVQLVRPRPPG